MNRLYYCIIFLSSIFFANTLWADSSKYPGMPDNTSLIVCNLVGCTDAQGIALVVQASKDLGKGTYYYLVGNISTGTILAYAATVQSCLCHTNSTGSVSGNSLSSSNVSVVSYPLPQSSYDYITDWSNESVQLKAGATMQVPLGAKGGEFDQTSSFMEDEGWAADLSIYLQGELRTAANPQGQLSALSTPVGTLVTVTLPDNSTAVFIYDGATAPTGYVFIYVPNTHKDAQGNPIPDPTPVTTAPTTTNPAVSTGSGGGGGGAGGGGGGGAGPENWFFLIPTTVMGTITVGPVVPVQDGSGSTGTSTLPDGLIEED